MQTYAQPGLGFAFLAPLITAGASIASSAVAAKISKPSTPKISAADASALAASGTGNFLSNLSTSELAIGGVAGVALLATLLR